MYKIIGGDGKEYGPVSGEDLRRWIAEGRLNENSLAQAAGGGDWKPLERWPEFATALARHSTNQTLPPGEAPPVSASEFAAQVLGREPQVQVGACLARSAKLLRANFAPLFGATLLLWLISLCEFVPVIKFLWTVFYGVFYGGLFVVFLRRIRGEQAGPAEVFSCFGHNFGQLILAGLITAILIGLGMVCCVLPGLYLMVAWTFALPLVADKGLEFWSAMELSRKVATRVWFPILGLLVLAYLPTILAAVMPRVAVLPGFFISFQHVLGAGTPDPSRIAAALSQFIKANLLMGLLTHVVLLFNLLFGVGAVMYAYEDLFGSRKGPTA